jgi:hypothetical protein
MSSNNSRTCGQAAAGTASTGELCWVAIVGDDALPVEVERSVFYSILLLEHSAMRFLLLIVIHCQQRASATFVR